MLRSRHRVGDRKRDGLPKKLANETSLPKEIYRTDSDICENGREFCEMFEFVTLQTYTSRVYLKIINAANF